MLDNPEYMEGVYSNLVNWKSCTALFVNMRGHRLLTPEIHLDGVYRGYTFVDDFDETGL
jgi:hypothetical protein